jgi:hypothetical protein
MRAFGFQGDYALLLLRWVVVRSYASLSGVSVDEHIESAGTVRPAWLAPRLVCLSDVGAAASGAGATLDNTGPGVVS